MATFTKLAVDLLIKAKSLDDALQQHGIGPTSYDHDTLDALPDDAQALRLELLDAAHNIRQLSRGARLSGLDVAFGWTDTTIMRTIWRYKVAQAIPLDGSATYDEIAAKTGIGRSLISRAVRAAITINIFDEDRPGHVRHTALSRLLATEEGYNSMIGLQVEDIGTASGHLFDVWDKDGADAAEPERSAFALANDNKPLFKVLSEDSVRAGRFDSAMKYCVQDKDFGFDDVLKSFDWKSIDKPGAKVVDLGGGYGQVSMALASGTQHISFEVQDLPHVIEKGRADLPAEYAGRVTFAPQNFLEPQQPLEEGETRPSAFIISRCLHNWSDAYCSTILKNLIPSLQAGAKVLIWDTVLQETPVKKFSEKFSFQQDFIMATIANGKDRSRTEFEQVLGMSDDRFTFEGVTAPKGSELGMVEVTWRGSKKRTFSSMDATSSVMPVAKRPVVV